MSLEIPKMVLVPGGSFLMGKEDSRADERPEHAVTVAHFLAAESPVTNADYATYAEETGASQPPFLAEDRFSAPEFPVVGINWFEATAYCQWLSGRVGRHYRLPTEAEREFAALGGLSGADWPWVGDNAAFVAWVNSLEGPHAPSPACGNGYGLLCMAENVHEWCQDWYSATYYAESPAQDPAGPPQGTRKASRGGSWRHREKTTRVNARSSLVPSFRYSDFGFRLYSDA